MKYKPRMMKMNGNESPTLAYSTGINRMAIHVFVHVKFKTLDHTLCTLKNVSNKLNVGKH